MFIILCLQAISYPIPDNVVRYFSKTGKRDMAFKHYQDRVRERARCLRKKEGTLYEDISRRLAEEFGLPEGPDVKTIGQWMKPRKQRARPPDSKPSTGEWLACREGDHDWKYTHLYDRTPSPNDWKPYIRSQVRKCRFCLRQEDLEPCLEPYEVSESTVHLGV